MRIWMIMIVLAMGSPALAAATERGDHAAGAPHGAIHEAPDTYPHPTILEIGTWAGVMIWIILGLFLAAAVIGPIVRANTPEEVPPAHSHDEPPGASHHHGAGGTHAIEPHD
jgi:hypothetical protein